MASRFFVEKVKLGMTDGGMACGPVGGDVIVTIQYRKDGGDSQWISNAESMGYATIYVNDFDPFELLLSQNLDNPMFGVGMVDSFEGIHFNDYEDMFEAFIEDSENSAIPLLRYLIAVTCCKKDEVDNLIAMAEGKYIDEVDVPISEMEMDYIDCLED